MKKLDFAVVVFLFLFFFPLSFASASSKSNDAGKKIAGNCRLNPRGCGMPEQAPGDFDTYWWDGDTYVKWDLETGATSKVHGTDWKQGGKYFHHGTETNKVEEVPVQQYYANTGQEGYWEDNGKIYRYNPNEKKVEEVSSTGYWKENGAVYTYDKSTEQPRLVSEDGYWIEGGKYYKLGKDGKRIEVDAVEYVLKGAKVSPGIRKTIKLELNKELYNSSGKLVYRIEGYGDEIECSASACYLNQDGERLSLGTYTFTGTTTGVISGSAEFTFAGISVDNLKKNPAADKLFKDACAETAKKDAIRNLGQSGHPEDQGKTDKKGSEDEDNTNIGDEGSPTQKENSSDSEKKSTFHKAENSLDSGHQNLPSQAGWHCEGKWAVRTKSSGQEIERKECDYKCENGECIEEPCRPLHCSYYYARKQCGLNLGDGCSGTLNCNNCPAGLQCVGGFCRCVPKMECSASSECGFESDGCGGRVSCGECRKGFQCNEYWHECVPEEEKQKLEVENIAVFPYSNHAIISWTTSVRAESVLEAGVTPELGSLKKVSSSAVNHSVFLDGLKPGQTYYYRVRARAGAQAVESKVFSFTTKTSTVDSGLKVLFVSVDPVGKVQYEGYSFSFTAITNAADQSKLEFDWDFGDGTRAENAGYLFFHAYYGLTEKEKDFNVRVVVRDEKGRTASGSVKVTVLKAVFKALVLKPKPFETVPKDQNLNVVIGFVDENNAVIPCHDINIRVLMENKLIEMKCSSGGSFSGSARVGPGVNDMQLLAIFAEHEQNGEKHFVKTRAPVYFAPLQVKATNAFKGKRYYLNDTIKSARVRFLLDDFFVVTPQELKASLVSTQGEKDVRVERSNYDYVVHFDHKVGEEDIERGLTLRLAGRDSRGNIISEFQSVPLEADNPELTIAVLEPAENKTEYAFSAHAVVRVKLFSNDPLVKDRKLYAECSDTGFEREMDYDPIKKEYSVFFDFPDSSFSKDKLTLKLYASALSGDKLVESVKFLQLHLSNKLEPFFVFPSAEKTTIFGKSIQDIYTRLLQPNGKVFNAKKIEAFLSVDGKTESVTLAFDATRKLYHARLSSPIPVGTHSLKLTLGSGYKGSTSILASIEEEHLLQGVAMVVGVALVLLLLALFASRLLRNVTSEKKLLINQKKRLIGLKKKYKYEYYKRHIGEREFRKSIKRLDGALVLINALLKKRHWLYTGFLKVFFTSKDPRKWPEFLQSASLVVRLAGRRGEFSRAEIARAMAEEKYSERVIERVLERLYG